MTDPTPRRAKSRRDQMLPFVRRVRAQGVRQIAADHDLNPLTRIPLEYDRWRWKRSYGRTGTAAPVFIVGLQRSGTNMLVRAFQNSAETHVYNENDRKAFDTFSLKSDARVEQLVTTSPYRRVVFKPLKDSHRTGHLLDALHVPSPGRAVWAYRGYEGRVRSSIGQFTDNNLRVLREVANGVDVNRWQMRGVSEEGWRVIRSFDYSNLNPESAAALMWFLRNSMYFDLGLDQRSDTTVVRYEGLLTNPQGVISAVAEFTEIDFHPRMAAHIKPRRPATRARLDIDQRVSELCDKLESRLRGEAIGA